MPKRPQRRHKTILATPAEIRVLASPVRQDVLHVVEALGICTVNEVARALGRRPDSLYYHVRALLKAGFLAADLESGEMQLRVRKRAVQLRYDPSSPRSRAATTAVVRAMLRGSERSFQRGFSLEHTVVEGPARTLWAGRVKGFLTKDELCEINRLIEDLLVIFQKRPAAGSSSKLIDFAFVLSPA